GRRNDPPRRVPTAWSSYAAQPSYIAVCTMARARAAIGGPGFATRIAWSAALSHRIATLSWLQRPGVRQRRPGRGTGTPRPGRSIPGYAIEHPEDRELQRGEPRATGRDGDGKGDVSEDRLHTRAKRVQHLHSGCATEAVPVRRPARHRPLHSHQMQSEEVRIAGHETREVSLRRSVTRDRCCEAEVRRVNVSIAVEIGAESRAAAACNLN